MNFYAGIGSQETPLHIQNIMHHIGAYLWTQEWTLRSGHASGADDAFEKGALTAIAQCVQPNVPQRMEIYLPWFGFNNGGEGGRFISPKSYPFTEEEMKLAAMHHPAWHKCTSSVRMLHQRNGRQMMGLAAIHGDIVKPTQFVVCWTKNGKMIGGTSQALRLAKSMDIPVFNLGAAQSETELEEMILSIDKLQQHLKAA